MVQTLAYCIGRVAPIYNLILVVFVIILFLKLFKNKNKKIFILPWKLLFAAVLVYVLEEIITVLEMTNLFDVSGIVYPLLEAVIITLFIYMLLLQRENNKK